MSLAMASSQHYRATLPGDKFFLPASAYTFEQLAEIYNQTRIDYIVPMPMNSKRLADYVRFYDVNLELSMVALNSSQSPTGLVMIGVRADHAWITRLGVLPDQRRHKLGQGLMEISLNHLRNNNIQRVQLEVIKGNEPAYRLFLKLGFIESRELLVIRRAPKPVNTDLLPAQSVVTALDLETIARCLEDRDTQSAWTEETASLLNTQALKGIGIKLPSGEVGWLIYQLAAFELTHIVLKPGTSTDMMSALIYQLHKQHPMHDTKIENIPRDDPAWPLFQKLGYLEVFSRIEMHQNLT
jgi:ribosomal protein S18 acetylase RimI-like enzyme